MSQDHPKTISIKAPIWAPRKFFSYDGKEPFIGLAGDKIEGLEVVDVSLNYLKERPTLHSIEVVPFMNLSRRRGWINQNGGHTVFYAPLSELKKLQQAEVKLDEADS